MSEEVPKKGKAGVVVNEGADFRVEVQEVDVPEISTCYFGVRDGYRTDLRPRG